MCTPRIVAVVVLALMMGAPASAEGQRADDRRVVERFYAQILTAGASKDLAADAEKILAADWASIGDYSGQTKDRDAFLKQMAGIMQLMPDLTWKIEDILAAGDRFVVRGRASGTPKGPFFGVEPSGKTFQIMSIDIHTVKGGRIVKSYHVEDWAGALGQLRAR